MSALTLIQQAQQQQHQQQQQCKCYTDMYLRADSSQSLILYNVYVVILVLVAADEDSVLFVDQQQLTQYIHFSQSRDIFMLFNVDVSFVQLCILLNQVRTHQLSYINAILIQSQGVLISVNCTNCQTHSMKLFLKCHCMSKHFDECCSNCK